MHHGLMDQSQKFKKTIASKDLSSYKVVKRGQLVVSFPIDEGVLDFQQLYDAAIVSPAYGIWDLIDPSIVDINYLGLALRSPRSLAYYKAKLQGSTARRRTLPKEVFLAMPVELPNIEEQKRRVLQTNLEKLIEQKRARQHELFHELDRAIFEEKYSQATNEVKLGEVVAMDSKLVDPTLPEYQEMPHIGPDSIISSRDEIRGWRTISEDQVKSGKYTFKKGDILYSKIRPNLNKVAVAPFDGLCSADIYPLSTTSNRVDAKYIQMILSSKEFLKYADSLSNRANIPKLNKKQLFAFLIRM
ncbi:Type I restriction modification DNA specificity domain [Mycobacteroides abscessus subsp. abscessus]|nr:Type I restriction modification DNA specificity domain [Mycobacteroides abscessus subsp. abscessus]